MDPEVQVGFFHHIFGQYYEKKNVYPASLGKKNWTPVVLVEPEFMFLSILGALNEALFSPGRMIGSFYSVSLVDYWRSLLCYVNTEILFDTELRMHGKEFNGIKPVALQIEVRRLLAQKEGFDTEDYGVDKVVNRSPEILSKIDAALRNLAGADKYERIMNFIHKYKEDAILASE